jgi:diguanylate cyclase (GGDEF)-like protein
LVLGIAMQAQQYLFRSYRQHEGLRNLAVNAMTTDSSGFLWVATENGVYRFLGSGFEQYGRGQGIAERNIEDIYADPGGTVWAGTGENLYYWNGQRFLAAGREPIHIYGAQHLATEDARHLLIVDRGRLFRLEHDSAGGMLSYTPVFSAAELASVPSLNHLSSVNVVGDHTVWMGCGNQLCSWSGGRSGAVTQWGTDRGVPESIWHAAVLDAAGTLWAAGQQHHVVVLPHGATRFADRSFPGPDPNSIYQHTALVRDRQNRVIVSTEGGIARWEGTAWRLIDPSNGTHIGHITSMAFDTVGDLWMGSFGYGIYHWIGRESWEGWTELQGLPNANILSTFPFRDDRVLVGTEKGPGWLNPRSGSAGLLFSTKKWTYGQVSGIGVNPDGSAWAGTFSGAIVRINQKTGRVNETAKLPALIVKAVQDTAGRVFFSTDAGIYLREAGNPNAAPHRVPAADALLGKSTRVDASCVSPSGAVWFLANNKLLREQNGRWTIPPVDGLPEGHGPLLDLACGADHSLWVTGLQSGTWRLTPNGSRMKAWQLVLPAQIQTLAPIAILVDCRGWVWLGTDWGLVVWNGWEWRHVTQENGLIWNDVNKGTLTNGSDGSLWVETSGGLGHLAHPERVFDSDPLAVSVTSIKRADHAYLVARQITLPWDASPLRFRISSPVMRDRTDLVFKYRMEGLQPEWTESQDGTATFSALPPGEYTFMAMAYNPGLNSYSIPVKIAIIILPPWWRSLWAYAICALLLLLLLAGAFICYSRHLRARSQKLERLVSERTRDLEASRAQLRIQATHDGLTGMLNRTAALQALSSELDRAQREKRTVVLALIDLDFFKHINDNYGHLAGDDALRWFASAVGTAIRSYDYAGRYGGEEFLLILPKVPREFVEQRLRSLHNSISNLNICAHGVSFTLNCSMGATVFDPSDGLASVESLLAVVDQALYAAKSKGRNRVVFLQFGSLVDMGESNAQSPDSPVKKQGSSE